MTTLFMLLYMFLESIELNVDLYLDLNQIIIGLDLNLIIFIKELVYDN